MIRHWCALAVRPALLEQLGLEPARKVLSELGGWPLIDGDAWDESKFDWRELTYKLVDMGMYGDYLFGFGLDRDISDTTKYSIEVRIVGPLVSNSSNKTLLNLKKKLNKNM